MLSAGFELAISAIKRPQTNVLARTTTGFSNHTLSVTYYYTLLISWKELMKEWQEWLRCQSLMTTKRHSMGTICKQEDTLFVFWPAAVCAANLCWSKRNFSTLPPPENDTFEETGSEESERLISCSWTGKFDTVHKIYYYLLEVEDKESQRVEEKQKKTLYQQRKI